MKRHIPLILLLAVVLCLSGYAGRSDLPTEPPTSATEDTPQAAESEKFTQMTTEERPCLKSIQPSRCCF